MPAAEQAWIDSLRAEAVGVRLVPPTTPDGSRASICRKPPRWPVCSKTGTRTTASSSNDQRNLFRLSRDRIHFVLCVPLAGLSTSSPQWRRSDLARRTHALWEPARINRFRLGARAARTSRPCGESFLELSFQTLGRDVMFSLTLDRDLDSDPRGLKADDLHVVGHVLPV
jgi:hypothetical protein